MSKTSHIKCQSNKQAHELRQYLVVMGISDDTLWNNQTSDFVRSEEFLYILIHNERKNTIGTLLTEDAESIRRSILLHTVPIDADLSEQAQIIKQKFENQE